MKERNAFLETFRTKEGKISFAVSTLSLIAFLCVSRFVPEAWQYRKIVLLLCGMLMFGGCVMFTQYVGAVQNQIAKEEAEAKKAAKHPHKHKK